MNIDSIAVVTPHIPTRTDELVRAVMSVTAQTLQPDEHIIVTDNRHDGAARTRNRAMYPVLTDWIAFLDDDDEFMPNHLEVLYNAAIRSDINVDVVYSGCQVLDGDLNEIPRREEWGRFGQLFDPELLRTKAYMPVTSLVKTDLAVQALFGPPATHPDSEYDDWGFYLRLLDLGAKFLHVPEVTWIWHHHGKNTSGQSDRW